MKILYCSDLDVTGSGYKNISIPLCKGLVERGHEVKVVGISYKGEEHNFPFTIYPIRNFNEANAATINLEKLWKPDIIVASLDIPWHEIYLREIRTNGVTLPYVGIFPIESDPLCLDWAMLLMQMQGQFCISKFGTEECIKMGVPAKHLQVGIDLESWRLPKPEEVELIRKALGFEGAYVILTVADNQERKNLGRAFQIVSQFRKKYKDKPLIYALVTRENSQIGFKLRTLAARKDIAIQDILRIFERGISFLDLWSLYAVADVFLLPSRAEGLGMPLIESMALNVPCVATDACGMHELLGDGRGFLIKPKFMYPDVFGNGNRYMVDYKDGAEVLLKVATEQVDVEAAVVKAREYVAGRSWDIAVDTLDKSLKEIVNEQKKP